LLKFKIKINKIENADVAEQYSAILVVKINNIVAMA